MGARAYLGNLPFNSTVDGIKDWLGDGQHCTVKEVKIITDRETGRSRGFAFVTFASEEELKAAVEELNGADFGGRKAVISVALDRPKGDRPTGGDRGGKPTGGDRGGDRGGKPTNKPAGGGKKKGGGDDRRYGKEDDAW